MILGAREDIMQEINRRQGGGRNADMTKCEKKAQHVTSPKASSDGTYERRGGERARTAATVVGGRPRGGREEDDRFAVTSGGSSFFRGKGGVPPVLTARHPRAGARFNSFCCAPRPYPRESILSKGRRMHASSDPRVLCPL